MSVRKGRKKLRKLIEGGGTLKVRLEGELISVWGNDDGIDQEFQMRVDSVEVIEREDPRAAKQ